MATDLENILRINKGKVLVFSTPYYKQAQSDFITSAKTVLTRSVILTSDKSVLEINKGVKTMKKDNSLNTYLNTLEAYLLKPKPRNSEITPLVIMLPEVNKDISSLNKAISSYDGKDYQAKAILIICGDQDVNSFKFTFNRVNLPDYIEGYLEGVCEKSHLVRLLSNNKKIVGMDGLSKWLKRRAICFDSNLGVKLKGISIFGVPGTGKSMAAFKCAEILNCPVYLLDIHSALEGLQGSSEKSIDQALSCVSTLGKAVILIDEVDKMFSNTAHDSLGTTQRILKKLLDFMQNNESVFFVLTGNSVSSIPPELIRRGRLNEYFYADLPNSEGIKAFILANADKYPTAPESLFLELASPLIIDKLQSLGYGLTDVEFLVEETVLDYLNNEPINIEGHIEEIVPAFMRNKDLYLETKRWSEENARNIN